MWANLRGAGVFPPGHFYSPLIDIEAHAPNAHGVEFDGPELWENIDLRPEGLRQYYSDLVANYSTIQFPRQKEAGFRYFSENEAFTFGDAFTLSAILLKEKPRRVIEVGSGFSSAVMLDTAARMPNRPSFTFIEPCAKRLESLITAEDVATTEILRQRVQEVPLSYCDQLEARDFLFIDSSHVGKVGSDRFQVMAFNCFAAHAFPEFFRENVPEFLEDSGGSLWLKKVR